MRKKIWFDKIIKNIFSQIFNHKSLVVLTFSVSNQKVKKHQMSQQTSVLLELIFNTLLNCTGVVVFRTEGDQNKEITAFDGTSLSLLYTTHPLKLLSTHNPLCGNLILYAFSVRLLQRYIRRGIIVFLSMQTSRSIVDAP